MKRIKSFKLILFRLSSYKLYNFGCSVKIFTFAGVIGIFVLLPVNCWGNQLEDFDVANFTSNSLDVFTISNVNSGSKW
jgi:hypothetical protein